VTVDTSSGTFAVVNTNTITTTTKFVSHGEEIQLGEVGRSFQSRLSGHLNVPGISPRGWFRGYAVENKE